MLKRIFESRFYDNKSGFKKLALNLISMFYYLYCYLFNDQHIFKVDSFHYCENHNDYIINLKIRNKGYILTVTAKEILGDKIMLRFVSSIDAYIIGIIYGMNQCKLIYNDSKIFLEFFSEYNHYDVVEPVILVSDIKFSDSTQSIVLKPKYCNTLINTTWYDISKNLNLIQNLSNRDAITIGIMSVNCFVGERCKNI